MSSAHPPLTYRQVMDGLKQMGFEARPQKATPHEYWTRVVDGRLYKVTVDKPKSPFSPMLIDSMAKQAGVTKKEFYRWCLGRG